MEFDIYLAALLCEKVCGLQQQHHKDWQWPNISATLNISFLSKLEK